MSLTSTQKKNENRIRRHRRVRSRASGTKDRPRLSVFKSNTNIYAQLVDDDLNKTLVGMSTKSVKGNTLSERAFALGKEVATIALQKKISKAVFDRGGYVYTGSVRAVSEGARDGGLTI
jgi:large subunit ribosomal protein L18